MLAWFRHRCALFGSTVSGVIFAVVFFTMWTVGVGVFSWELADDLADMVPTLLWQPVTATVTDQTITTVKVRENERPRRLHRVTCEYELNGVRYSGPDDSPRKYIMSKAEVEAWKEKFQPGSKVTLFVNPTRPTQGVFRRGIEKTRLQLLIVLTPFWGVELLLAIVGFWWIRGLSRNETAPGVFTRSAGVDSLEVAWNRVPCGAAALVSTAAAGFLCALLSGAFENLWILSAIGLLPFVATFAAWRWERKRFWTGECRLFVSSSTRSLKRTGSNVALSAHDVAAFTYALKHDSDSDGVQTTIGSVYATHHDESVELIAEFSASYSRLGASTTVKMFAEWLATAIGVEVRESM